MLKRYIIILFAFVAIAGSINAQIRPGVKMGYNLGGVLGSKSRNSDNPYSAGYADNFKMQSGFQIGMIADCPVSEVLAIQPGVRFAMQGFRDEWKSGSHSKQYDTRTFSIFYVQVPVNVQYRMNVAEETNVLFQAGPYANFAIFGRQTRIFNGKNETENLSSNQKKIDFERNELPRIDYGVGAGVGIEFFPFQFMFAYDYGISKVKFDKDARSGLYNIDLQNHCFSATLAIIFGRRDPLQSRDIF